MFNKIKKVIMVLILISFTIPTSYASAAIIKQETLSDGSICYHVSTPEENFLVLSMIQARMETEARIIYSGDMILNPDDYFNILLNYIYMPQYQVFHTQHGIGSFTGYVINTKSTNNKLVADFNFTYFETKEQTKYVYDKIHDEILANISNLKTDYQKAYWAYQWVINNTQYDFTYSNYSSYDALQTTGTVCQGYATLYCTVANELGLDCAIVMGGVNGESSNHAWNIIKLDGRWYCLDATWDDYKNSNQYFLKTKEEFSLEDYGYHISSLYDNYINVGESFATTDYDITKQLEIHPIMPSVYNIQMDVLKCNTLDIGEGYTFMINNVDNIMIDFNSSNSNIATVDQNGVITGVSEGTTIISAFNKDLNIEQKCKISVVARTDTPILSRKEIKLKSGSKATIDIKNGLLGSKIKFISSNPKVAKVSKETGNVTALKKGKCKITCTITNGTSIYILETKISVE